MARGLSREQSKEKNLKKTKAGASKGNTEGLTPQQRAERCVPGPSCSYRPPRRPKRTSSLFARSVPSASIRLTRVSPNPTRLIQ